MNTSRLLRFLSVAMLFIALAGCFSGSMHTGNVIDDQKIEQIQKGKTPVADLITWFGSPASKMVRPDGSERYTFSSMDHKYKSNPLVMFGTSDATSGSRVVKQLSVTVHNGIVLDYSYSQSNQ